MALVWVKYLRRRVGGWGFYLLIALALTSDIFLDADPLEIRWVSIRQHFNKRIPLDGCFWSLVTDINGLMTIPPENEWTLEHCSYNISSLFVYQRVLNPMNPYSMNSHWTMISIFSPQTTIIYQYIDHHIWSPSHILYFYSLDSPRTLKFSLCPVLKP